MASTNKTSLGLNMWEASDKPVRQDFINDNKIIDERIAKLNSDIDKKFSSNWVNYSGKSLFDIFVPISPTGIYSIADADDTPTVGMKWFVLIKTTERMILFHDTGVYFTRSDGNIWKRVWIKI